MSAIRFSQIDHCSVLITNLARARWFYRDVLGLPEISKPKTFDFVALWFALPEGQTLHLLQKPVPDTRSPRHFALRVSDARQAREHFRSHGVEIQETGPIPHCDRFFVNDPDGNRIELIQWLETYDPTKSGAEGLD
ncbi:MAG TPA: VOC family protein [Gemmata sp.]|jgi:catechol 2,3-dioxygenase-like lactoylglutathione lyase family enzyme|nr:VOC family protein [Gemmata sp.]